MQQETQQHLYLSVEVESHGCGQRRAGCCDVGHANLPGRDNTSGF